MIYPNRVPGMTQNAAPTPYRSGNAPDLAFGSGGAGLSQLGRGLAGAAQAADRIAIKNDKTRVMEARNTFADWSRQRVFAEDGGYLHATGRDAMTGAETISAEFDSMLEELSEGLGNNRQKSQFAAIADQSRQQALERVASHALRERNVWRDQTSQAAIKGAGEAAMQTPEEARAMAEHGNLDEAATERMVNQNVASYIEKVSESALSDNPELALKIFEQNRIALAETLGPDPEATLRMMEELAHATDKAAFIGRIGQACDLLTGKEDRAEYRLAVENAARRRAAENQKSLQPLAVATFSDFSFLKDASFFAKIPDVRMPMHSVRKLDPANPKDRTFARRAAGIADCFIRAARRGQRLAEEFGQTGLTRFIAHAPLAAPGLKAHGDAVRDAFRLEMLAILADMSDRTWASLPAEIRAVLKQGGLDEKTWDAARRFALLDDGFGGCFMDPGSLIRANDPELAEAGQTLHDRIKEGVST